MVTRGTIGTGTGIEIGRDISPVNKQSMMIEAIDAAGLAVQVLPVLEAETQRTGMTNLHTLEKVSLTKHLYELYGD